MASVTIPLIIDDKGTVTLGKVADGLDKVGKAAKKTQVDLSSVWAGVAAGGAVALGVFTAAAAGFAAMAKSAAAAGGAMADIADKTGLSVESLSSLELAAKASGTSLESVGGAVNKMQKAIVENSEAFKALGVNLAQLKTMAPEKQFETMSRAILAIKDPAQQTAAAMAIFGKSGAELLPMMKAVAKGAGEMSDAIGGKLSSGEVQSLDALDDSLTGLGEAWDRLEEHFIAALNESGLLSGAIDTLSKALGTASGWITSNAGFFRGLSMAIADLVGWVKAAAREFGLLGGISIRPGSLLDRVYKQTTEIGDADLLKDAQALARRTTDMNRSGDPSGGTYAPADPKAQAAAAAAAARLKALDADRLAFLKQTYRDGVAASKAYNDEIFRIASDKAAEILKTYKEQREAEDKATQKSKDFAYETANFQRDMVLMQQQDAAQAEADHLNALGDKVGDIGGLLSNIGYLFDAIGVSAESGLGRALGALDALAGAAQGFFKSMATGNVVGMIGSAIGGIAGVIGSLFGGGGKKKAEEKAKRDQLLKDSEAQLKGLAQQWDQLRRSFIDKGASGVGALFANIANGAEGSAERMARLGRLGGVAFALLRKEGLSTLEIMKQMGPSIDAAIAAAKKSGHKLTGPMAEMADLKQKTDKNQKTVAAVDGLNDLIAMMRSTGTLTQETVGDATAELKNLNAELLKAGFTPTQALMTMAPALYQLAEAEKAGTIQVDAATQALIDQAEAANLFDGMQDPMAALVEIQQQMLLVTAALAEAFGATLPASVQKYIDELNQIPTIPGPPGGAPTPGTTTPPPAGDGGKYPQYASGGIVRTTGLAMLHGTPAKPEMVLNHDQWSRIINSRVGTGTGARPGTQVHIGTITSNASDPKQVAAEVVRQIEARTNPRLNTAIREAR